MHAMMTRPIIAAAEFPPGTPPLKNGGADFLVCPGLYVFCLSIPSDHSFRAAETEESTTQPRSGGKNFVPRGPPAMNRQKDS